MDAVSEGERPVYAVNMPGLDDPGLRDMIEALGHPYRNLADADAFCGRVGELPPGVILIGVGGSGEGLAILRALRTGRCLWPVAVLSEAPSIPLAVEAIRCGAFDFVAFPPPHGILEAVLHEGFSQLTAAVEEESRRKSARDLYLSLSPRQAQVFEGVTLGLSNKHIARKYGLSPRTIDGYRAAVARKLGTKSAFAMLAIRSLAQSGDVDDG